MTLTELIEMTRLYARDTNSYVFTDSAIKLFLNQALDRVSQYSVFKDINRLQDGTDEPTLIPKNYQYFLALFAASRCLEMDERFYEGIERRNEFEGLLDDLIANIQSGNIVITDGEGNEITDGTNILDAVVDVYFKPKETEILEDGDVEDDNTVL